MMVVGDRIHGQDLIGRRGTPQSNRDHRLGWDWGGRMPWSPAWASPSLSYGARNVMRFDPTQSRRQGEPVLQTYSEGNGRGRVGDGEVSLWRRWGKPPAVLWLWRAALQLRLAPLKLLLGSIASYVDESSSCGSYLHVVGLGACRKKFDEYKPLFIGLLSPTRRGDGVQWFLYTNQTLTRLCLGDFWKGVDSG
jgi:hypothetical protein